MINRPRFKQPALPARYPDLETRKIITAEILVARSFARIQNYSAEEDLRKLIGVKGYAHKFTRDDRTLDSECSLGEHLKAVGGLLRDKCASSHTKDIDLNVLGDAFDSEVAEIPEGELGSKEVVGSSDSTLSYAGWDCVDQLFSFVSSAVESTYAWHLPDVECMDVAAQLLATGGNYANDVIAKTRFDGDCLQTRNATIVVEFSRETFSQDQYFGLLGKLYHELFVHAVQAITLPGRRVAFGEDCPLAEGFLDRAAYLSLMEALCARRLPRHIQACSQRFRRRSEAQQGLRMSEVPETASNADKIAAAARIFGCDLFDRLVEVRGGGDDAKGWVIGLGMRLNLCDLSKIERRNLAIHVSSSIEGPVIVKTKTLEALAKIVDGADPRALFPLIAC